jgi:16S rRNA (guanine966-N2)-methyltransferase
VKVSDQRIALGVRPTRGRVRQAIFNVLRHRFYVNFQGATVLDGFAGTGAFGLDAISLGARVTFVEKDAQAAEFLKKRVGPVHNVDLLDFRPEGPFNVVFLDPPYFKDLIVPATLALQQSGAFANTVLVFECASKEFVTVKARLMREVFMNNVHGNCKIYGNTTVYFCRI